MREENFYRISSILLPQTKSIKKIIIPCGLQHKVWKKKKVSVVEKKYYYGNNMPFAQTEIGLIMTERIAEWTKNTMALMDMRRMALLFVPKAA